MLRIIGCILMFFVLVAIWLIMKSIDLPIEILIAWAIIIAIFFKDKIDENN